MSVPVKAEGTSEEVFHLRGMFEGQPLPIAPLHVYELPLWLAVIGLCATTVLRLQFEREWALTMWSAYQIKRVWQRLADESARTGGTLTSHALGVLSWVLLGSLWGITQSQSLGDGMAWRGAQWGLGLGFITLLSRQLAGWVGAWVTLEWEAVQRGYEVDRHMRNWLLWLLIALVCWELSQFSGFEHRANMWGHVTGLWWLWLALKWVRQFQSLLQKRLQIGWGIAYICTLEIGPSLLLYEYLG